MSYFESSNEFTVSSQQTLLGPRALSLRLPISLSNMMSPHGPKITGLPHDLERGDRGSGNTGEGCEGALLLPFYGTIHEFEDLSPYTERTRDLWRGLGLS
jgi:hypothetical protein